MDDELRELLKEFLNGMRSGGASGGRTSSATDFDKLTTLYEKSVERVTKGLIKVARGSVEEETIRRNLESSVKEATKSYNDGSITLKEYRKTLSELTDELTTLDDLVGENNDSILKSTKIELKKAVALEQAAKKAEEMREQMTPLNAALKTAKGAFSAISAVGSVVGGLIKGLQTSASGMTIATDLMKGGVDVAAGGVTLLGDMTSGAGTIMAGSTNPRLRMLGIAASVAGTAISGFAASASKLAKFGIEVLSKEVEKTVNSYNTMNTAGAIFTDGMTGMRNAASAAGLTVEQMSNVVKESSSTIAASGLGVTNGVKKIGAALTAGGKTMQSQMLKLGFGYEQQAELVAETIRSMRQTGTGNLSDRSVAEQTQKYAENLRTIAAITGEDAKKRQEAVKQQASQLMFQQQLASKSPEQRAAIERAMQNMTDSQRKNFMDMVNFGSIINKEGAILAAQSGGVQSELNQIMTAYKSNMLDDTEMRRISAANGEQIRQDMLSNSGIAAASAAGLSGIAADMGKVMGEELQTRIKWNKDAIEAASRGVEGQKNTVDKLTEGVMSAEQAAQGLKISLEQTLTPAISKFASVSGSMLSVVERQLKELGLGEGQQAGISQDSQNWKSMSVGEKIESGLARSIEKVGSLADTITGGLVSGMAQILGGKSVEEIRTERVERETEYLNKKGSGFALGGLATGPTSGYLEKLHGTEIVIPTYSGKLDYSSKGFEILSSMISNDNSVTTTDNSSKMSESTVVTTSAKSIDSSDLMKKQVDLMVQFVEKADEIVTAVNEQKSIQQSILQATY